MPRYYPRPGLAEVYVARDHYRATLVSAGPAGADRWLFQPFGRTLVAMAVPIDERHVLAVAEDDAATVAVFDVVDRREVARRSDVFSRSIVGFTIASDGKTLLVHRGAYEGDAKPLPRFLSLPSLAEGAAYPAPGPRAVHRSTKQPMRLLGVDAADRGDGSFVVTLGNGRKATATCIAHPDGRFDLDQLATPDPDEVELESLSPRGTYLVRRVTDRLLVQRTGTDNLLHRLGLASRNRPKQTGAETVYGIGLEIWRTAPIELAHRIVVHGLCAADAAYQKASTRRDLRTVRLDTLLAPRRLPEPLPFGAEPWTGEGSYWVYPKSPIVTAADHLSASVMRAPADYLSSVSWEDDESGFTITLADGRRRRVALDGTAGPLLDPLPPAYPYVARQPSPAIDAAEEALAALTRVALPVRDLSERQCVRSVARLAARVRRRLPELVFGHDLRIVFQVGDEELDEPAFFDHVARNCPRARDALRALFAAYIGAAPSIPLGLVSQIYYDEENGALTAAATALASIDPDAHDHLQGWFDLRDPGHEVGATSYVLPGIARVGAWRSAAHVRFGLHELARQHLEGTGGVALADFGILDGARAHLAPDEFAACVDDVGVRLSVRHGYEPAKADGALRDLVLAELRPGEQWDDAVGARLAIADAA